MLNSVVVMALVRSFSDGSNLWRSHWLTLFSGPLMVATSILSGCQLHVDPKAAGEAAAAGATGEDYQIMVKDNVPLYAAGPGQFTPPDQRLDENDVVWVVKKQIGFTLVQTSDGQMGWVPAEDLARSTPPETVIVAAPPRSLPTSHSSHSRFIKQKSIHSIKRNSAIVEHYTIPNSDMARASTLSP